MEHNGNDELHNSEFVFRRFRIISKLYYELHVYPPVRVEQLGSHWTDLYET